MGDERVAVFWDEFVAASDVDASYTAWAFGADDDPQQQTQLGRLVLEGPKRATTGMLAEYQDEKEPLPLVGEYSVIIDGGGEPLCVIRTTAVEVRRFGDVDEGFAWTEGEGDRSLGWWRDAHIGFFARQGRSVTDDTEVVLERFDLVWPETA